MLLLLLLVSLKVSDPLKEKDEFGYENRRKCVSLSRRVWHTLNDTTHPGTRGNNTKRHFSFNGTIKGSLEGPLWVSDLKAAQGNFTNWQLQMEARDKCLKCNEFSRQKSNNVTSVNCTRCARVNQRRRKAHLRDNRGRRSNVGAASSGWRAFATCRRHSTFIKGGFFFFFWRFSMPFEQPRTPVAATRNHLNSWSFITQKSCNIKPEISY